jgi:hypothetical protein
MPAMAKRKIGDLELLMALDGIVVAGRHSGLLGAKDRPSKLSRGKRAMKTLLICGLIIPLSGCIKRYSVVNPPPPPETTRPTLMRSLK